MINDEMYVCHLDRIEDNGKSKKKIYKAPKPYKCVISPVSGELDIAAYGERINKMFVASMDRYKAREFREDDRVYYQIEPPKVETISEEDETSNNSPQNDNPSDVSQENEQNVGGNETSLEEPETSQYEKPYGRGANYKVVSVRPYNIKTRVYFELLP